MTVNECNKSDYIKNRRINYTIIRRMWDVFNNGIGAQVVKGHEHDKESLMGTFEISKSKLNEICDAYEGNLHFNTYSKRMEEKTGIPQKVFTGEIKISLNEDLDKNWEKYFIFKDRLAEKRAEAKKLKKPIPAKDDFQKTFENDLFNYLNTMNQKGLKAVLLNNNENLNLFLVYNFIREKEKYYLDIASEEDFDHTVDLLNKVDIDKMELFNNDTLERYLDTLKKQYELASAVLVYRNRKPKAKG